jgi:hypothetical protein
MRLRLATPAPEGSAYACELHSFSREVLRDTGGHLEAKWYMGGSRATSWCRSSACVAVASLGGSGAEYRAAAAGADAAPEVMLRAARWYDARQHADIALSLWRRLAARDDAGADARAQAEWSLSRAERKGEPWQPRAALDFARRHPATMIGWRALVYAASSPKVTRAEVVEALVSPFVRSLLVGALHEQRVWTWE